MIPKVPAPHVRFRVSGLGLRANYLAPKLSSHMLSHVHKTAAHQQGPTSKKTRAIGEEVDVDTYSKCAYTPLQVPGL